MTDMELRIKVAELVKWRNIAIPKFGRQLMGLPPWYEGENPHLVRELVPDYPNDLNAMNEAENLMTEEQKYRYDTVLENRTKYHTESPRWRWNATARQRAEAYVKVMEQYT